MHNSLNVLKTFKLYTSNGLMKRMWIITRLICFQNKTIQHRKMVLVYLPHRRQLNSGHLACQSHYFLPCRMYAREWGLSDYTRRLHETSTRDLLRTHSGLLMTWLGLVLNRLNTNTFKLNESAVRNSENPGIWAHKSLNLKVPSCSYWKYTHCHFHSKLFTICSSARFHQASTSLPLITLSECPFQCHLISKPFPEYPITNSNTLPLYLSTLYTYYSS